MFHYLLDYEQKTRIFTSFFEIYKNKKAVKRTNFERFTAYILEQDTGLEPAAYCLGSSRSTG